MSEYILIVTLVVIAVVVSFHLFGSSISKKFFGAGDSVKETDDASTDASTSGNRSGTSSSSSKSGKGSDRDGIGDGAFSSKYFADEEALKQYEDEKRKAWFKTMIVFAVAGAILLMLVFMTVERIRLIKKQIQMQADQDDYRRDTRFRKPVTFKKPLKPKDD